MSPLNFAIIALRLMGIYFFVESVPLFSTAVLEAAFAQQISATPDAPRLPAFSELAIYLAFVPPLSLLVLSVLTFAFAVPLAYRLIPYAPTEAEKTAWSFEDIQAIVFAAAGIVVLTSALPGLGRALMNLYQWYGIPVSDRAIASNRFTGDWTHSVGVIAQLIVGLILVLSPQGFRNLWRFMRTAGTRPRSEISQ